MSVELSSPSDRLLDHVTAEGSDKGVYCSAYEVLLRNRRQSVRCVLEIGIGTMTPGAHSSMKGYMPDDYRPGASLRAWRRYFPRAHIIGVDVQPDTQLTEERIATYLCDSTDTEAVRRLRESALAGVECDLIVDDGSHLPEDQLATLANFFPMLRRGGLYIIEDIGRHNALHQDYRLIEQHIGGADYLKLCDDNPVVGDPGWMVLAIQK